MTTSRFLPIANLIGCLLITGIIVAQWLKERGLDTRIDELNQQLVAAHDLYEGEKIHADALANDVSQLKESVESTVKARKETEEALFRITAERDAMAASANAAATTANQSSQEQVKIWQKAIADRDAKILELNSTLTATRERLNEAISKLKEAGAR